MLKQKLLVQPLQHLAIVCKNDPIPTASRNSLQKRSSAHGARHGRGGRWGSNPNEPRAVHRERMDGQKVALQSPALDFKTQSNVSAQLPSGQSSIGPAHSFTYTSCRGHFGLGLLPKMSHPTVHSPQCIMCIRANTHGCWRGYRKLEARSLFWNLEGGLHDGLQLLEKGRAYQGHWGS